MARGPGAPRSQVRAPAGARLAEVTPASAHDAVREVGLVTWALRVRPGCRGCCQPTPGVLRTLRKSGSQAPDSPGTTGPMKGRAQGFSW